MENEKLVAAREDRNWTQEEVANKIGVTRTAYARWEKGIIPRPWAINQTCEIFHMTPEQLGFKQSVNKLILTSSPLVPITEVSIVTNANTATNLFNIGVQALALAQKQYRWTFEELQAKTEQEMRRLDTMELQQGLDGGKLSRRQIISLIMSVPAVALGMTQAEAVNQLHDDEVIALCSTNIPLAWRLYFTGGLDEVRQILPSYMNKLSVLAQQPSRYQHHAAGLASQAHQLQYLLALQSQDFSVAQTHVKRAFQYAEIADDSNLRVASLVRQGNLFFTLKRPLQTMQKYQEAIQYSNNASPLIVGQAYIGLAEAKARLGQREDAERFRGLALDTFPEHPEEDLQFAYTHFNHFTRVNFEGLMYLHLGQPKKAWDTFADIDKSIPTAMVPQRVELLSRQALASVALGDLEQSHSYIEQAVSASLRLGSDLRYNEVCETYLLMQSTWPNERSVKALEDLFIR